MYTLVREQWIPSPPEQVFEFFADAENLEQITPEWLKFRIVTPTPIEMDQGTEIHYEIHWGIFRLRWKTAITHWSPPYFFVDVQENGPYKFWEHTHTFRPEAGGTRMFDTVRYELPLGIVGRLAHSLKVQKDLNRIFDYRAAKIGEHFERMPHPSIDR